MEPEQMNEQYREKRFPQGSVLIRSNEKTRKSSKVLLVLVALLELLLAAGEVYFLSLIRYHKEAVPLAEGGQLLQVLRILGGKREFQKDRVHVIRGIVVQIAIAVKAQLLHS